MVPSRGRRRSGVEECPTTQDVQAGTARTSPTHGGRKLRLDWSPEQIAGWLERTFPDDLSMQVSHETIYKSLFVQARGVLERELLRHLRSGRVMRCARNSTTEGQQRGRIVDAISIRERPAEVEDRAVPGHWEGDLLSLHFAQALRETLQREVATFLVT